MASAGTGWLRAFARPLAALAILTALVVATALVAGCGSSSSSTPDVSGAPASDSATLFKASNLNKVLVQTKGKLGGAPVTVLKIEPRDVKVVGQNKTVTVDASGKSIVVGTPTIPGQATFDLGVVSPATVEKVVSAVESKGRLKQSDIAYVAVAVDPTNNKPFYGVYPVSGSGHYQADINGGNVRSFGGSGGGTSSASGTQNGGASGSAATPSGATPSGAAKNPQAIAQCVSKAGGDPQKIAACTGG